MTLCHRKPRPRRRPRDRDFGEARLASVLMRRTLEELAALGGGRSDGNRIAQDALRRVAVLLGDDRPIPCVER